MSERHKIVVVDDEPDMLENCSRLLRRMGHECLTCDDGQKALETIRTERPAVVLTDLMMPHTDGMAVLKATKELDPDAVVILFTAYGTFESAVEAVKQGAFDYIAKPFTADQLKISLDRGLTQRALTQENRRLRSQLKTTFALANIIGNSHPMREVLELVRKVAPRDVSVLIQGETGTGKELIARCLHANSGRYTQSFVPVDCASLPEALLESELFGHEKGAFTGADAQRRGLFEEAHGGTIFLDEVGELSPSLQAKLLRALEERRFRRVGGNKEIAVDVRVLAATSVDIPRAIADKRFREELYYRLNVVTVFVPPLRERREDVPLIAKHYLDSFASSSAGERQAPQAKSFSPEAMALLKAYHWPGNVRELRNVVERAVALAESLVITPHDLPDHVTLATSTPEYVHNPSTSFKAAKSRWVAELERQYLTQLLRRHGGNITRAAEEAGTDRKTVHRLLRKYGIPVLP